MDEKEFPKLDAKKQLTTEEELRKIFLSDCPETKDEDVAQINRLVDLIIDLIAERSEEKAQEVLEEHNLDYDHDVLYGGT